MPKLEHNGTNDAGCHVFEISLQTRSWLLNGKELRLSPREAAALKELVAKRGKWVSSEELQEKLWGELPVSESAVRGLIRLLRRKLKPHEDLIETKLVGWRKGGGWRLKSEGNNIAGSSNELQSEGDRAAEEGESSDDESEASGVPPNRGVR
jgi:DNA-binding response OmpR family regulator